ncbi:MAG: F0F1 ATP synthase subunit alpha [Clostridiaceae bacterium]|jgi:F-type H+-transporting ATPase subunit alpha|nr:F0F1 ATP synthase subunit alpha [Clostridiaceae bacterium]
MPDQELKIIRIISSVPLDLQKGQDIAKRFAERYDIPRFEVKLETDPSLIGGLVIYAGGFRYDYSIRGQLNRIASRLKTQQSIESDISLDASTINHLIRDNLDEALADFSEQPMAPDGEDLFLSADTIEKDQQAGSTQRVIDRMREKLDSFDADSTIDEIGEVLRYSDGVATVSGLQNCRNNELIAFTSNVYGIAMNLEEHQVGVVMLQQNDAIREGMICKRTGSTVQVPTGQALLGRVVDPLGKPIDGLGPIQTKTYRPIEYPALSIVDRQPITVSLQTGVTAIDAMTPIGRGQRELIVGDRQTGKTALAIDTIINQKNKNVFCIYVAIGQKMSTVSSVVNVLQTQGAMAYTTVVVASASTTASLQYIAPYAGCTMAEALMYEEGADVLIVYDDLTKHAQSYRAISLLLRRPPGREAYPGDIFYLHARLLERSGRRHERLGGGSITALPIVETQSGDISAYIPTNVISITDGQIYLESELFFAGQRPAINVGLSVSRVGGSAQTKAMKKVAGPLRINLAQYRSLEAFSQFSSELDDDTRRQLMTGERLMEVLKQPQYDPLPVEEQVVMLYLANRGVMVSLDREDIHPFLQDYIRLLQSKEPDLMREISVDGRLTDEGMSIIDQTVETYLPRWRAENEAYAATV